MERSNFEKIDEMRNSMVIDGRNYFIDPKYGPKLSSAEEIYKDVKDENILNQIKLIFEKYKNRERNTVEIKPDQIELINNPNDEQKKKAWDILVLTYQDYILSPESKEAGENPEMMVVGIKGTDEVAGVLYRVRDESVIEKLKDGIAENGGNIDDLNNDNTVVVDFLAVNPFIERGHLVDIEKVILDNFKNMGYKYLISETAVLNLHEMYRKMGFELFINEDIKNKGMDLLSKINSTNPVDLAKIEIPKEYELLFRYDNLPKVPTQIVLLSENAYLLKKL